MFLVAAILAMAMPDDRWIHVGGEPDLYEEFLDKASVVRSEDKVTLWTRRDFRDESTVWHEIQIECSARMEIVLAYIRDHRGTISHSIVRPHRGRMLIPPDSAQERIHELVCR